MISLKADTIPGNTDEFFEYALSHDFGELHCKIDPKTGMQAIIAIHNTKLGPALGGCRFIEYESSAQAIYDAMRLARGMSYKAASVDLPLGGGKAVIMKPRGSFDRTEYFNLFGQFVNDLGGRYITALDSGTQLSDMDIIAQHTPYVASRSHHDGDPSPYTAQGVFKGIEAAVDFKLHQTNLQGIHVAIQGLGHVGYLLAKQLHEAGARLTVADINKDRVQQVVAEFDAMAVSTDSIHTVACDVFAPCALGAVVNDQSLPEIQAPIIAGAANNQLAHTYHGQKLYEKGILYVPDYVLNAGGLIYAASKYLELPEHTVNQKLNALADALLAIFKRSQQEQRPTSEIADQLAKEKLL